MSRSNYPMTCIPTEFAASLTSSLFIKMQGKELCLEQRGVVSKRSGQKSCLHSLTFNQMSNFTDRNSVTRGKGRLLYGKLKHPNKKYYHKCIRTVWTPSLKYQFLKRLSHKKISEQVLTKRKNLRWSHLPLATTTVLHFFSCKKVKELSKLWGFLAPHGLPNFYNAITLS